MFWKQRENFCFLVSPILFLAIAASLGQYPLYGRMLLFFLPILLLLIAEGSVQIIQKVTIKPAALAVALCGLLFFYPTLTAGRHIARPRTFEEIRPVMSYVRDHWQDGDLLYIYHGSTRAFEYYNKRYGFAKMDCILGRVCTNNYGGYEEDLSRLHQTKRVWFIFSHAMVYGIDEEEMLLNLLTSMGTRLDFCKAPGATVYLYNLERQQADAKY